MENFNYNVIIHNNGNEIVIKTNDVTYAIREHLRACEAGCEVCLCNGFTGEVLCHNGEEPWCTDEMALMILGYMCAEAWGDEDEDEDVPICQSCGGEIDENGNCEWCGRFYGSADVPADGVVANPIVALLDEMVAQGKAVKLGGLPS